MAWRGIKRSYKKLSPAERAKYEKLTEQVEAERPEIEAWVRETLARLASIDHVVRALHSARLRKGISLSQVEEASGLGRSNVSRLENARNPNPTLETLLTYAEAVGVELRIAVVDKATGTILASPEARQEGKRPPTKRAG